jgi:hypothetical protein
MEKGKRMRTRTKTYGEDLEIIEIAVNAALTITVEVFKVHQGFKSFARNSNIHHDDVLGTGVHNDKNESMELALKELHEQMEDFDNNI